MKSGVHTCRYGLLILLYHEQEGPRKDVRFFTAREKILSNLQSVFRSMQRLISEVGFISIDQIKKKREKKMKMIKKVLSVCLAIAITLQCGNTAFAEAASPRQE